MYIYFITELLLNVYKKYSSLILQAILITIALFSFVSQVGSAVIIPSHGSWGIYHYFINAKYFKELGYFNLYSCTLQAESKNLQGIEKARDLSSYKIVPVKSLEKCDVVNFGESRWDNFRRDLSVITRYADSSYWTEAVTDKGFNPTPFWAAIAGNLIYFFNIENNTDYLLLFNLDFVLIIIASFLVLRHFGRLAGLLTLTLAFNYFGNYGLLTNNFLQYAWFILLTASIILWKSKRYKFSGFFLGLATGMQAFPGVFAIPVFFLYIFSLLKNDKETAKISSSFSTSFLITLLSCIAIGSVYAGNANTWQQWYQKITIHRNYINGELFNIGLPNLLGTVITNYKTDTYLYSEDQIFSEKRGKEIKNNRKTLLVITLILVFIVLLSLWKNKYKDPFPYGYFFAYIFLTLSPYYYLTLALIPLVFWNHTIKTRINTSFLVFLLFYVHSIILNGIWYVNLLYRVHLLSEILIFLFFIIIFLVLQFEKQINIKK